MAKPARINTNSRPVAAHPSVDEPSAGTLFSSAVVIIGISEITSAGNNSFEFFLTVEPVVDHLCSSAYRDAQHQPQEQPDNT